MWTGGTAVLAPGSTTFLSKFCFTFNPEGDHKSGLLDFTVTASAAALRLHKARMVLFDDEIDSYTGPSSEWNTLTCEDRLQNHSKRYVDLDWTQVARPEGQQVVFRIIQKLRPRWWYVALLDCSNKPGLSDVPLTWEAHLWNPGYGVFSEFSTDRRFSLHLFVPLALVYGVLTACQFAANRVVAAKAGDDSASGKASHPFAWILSVGLLLGTSETVLFVLHALTYVFNGVGAPSLAVISQLLATMSSFVLASLLLLVSEGKCVSYIMVAGDARRMLRMLGPFLVSCCCLELWGEYSLRKNYTTDYVYTTPFGWALICVDLFLLSIYVRNTRTTYMMEKECDEGKFYRTWGVLFGVWFLALPITAILAQAVLAPYVWWIVSLSVKKGLTVLVYGALVIGLWPGNTRSYFKLEMMEAVKNRLTPSSVWRAPSSSSGPVTSMSNLFPLPKTLPGLLGSKAPPWTSSDQEPDTKSPREAHRSGGRKHSVSMSP